MNKAVLALLKGLLKRLFLLIYTMSEGYTQTNTNVLLAVFCIGQQVCFIGCKVIIYGSMETKASVFLRVDIDTQFW